MMSETVDKVSEQLTRLEVTVAQGFHDVEARDLALSGKIDVNTEAVRGDVKTVLDGVTSLAAELRRTTEALRQEHSADRALLTLSLQQHARRLHDMEQRGRPSSD